MRHKRREGRLARRVLPRTHIFATRIFSRIPLVISNFNATSRINLCSLPWVCGVYRDRKHLKTDSGPGRASSFSARKLNISDKVLHPPPSYNGTVKVASTLHVFSLDLLIIIAKGRDLNSPLRFLLISRGNKPRPSTCDDTSDMNKVRSRALRCYRRW